MGEVKQRDYVFDALRGLCMWSIPISHFTRMAGHFSQGSLSGNVTKNHMAKGALSK